MTSKHCVMGRGRATSWIPGETLRAANRHPPSCPASLSTSREARAQEQFVEWRSEWRNKRMKKCPIRLKLRGSSWWSGLQGSPRTQRRENRWAVSFILPVSLYQCSQVSFSEASSRTQWPNKAPWRMRTNTSMPQAPPIMVPSAPKCQFCLICHFSLKNTPIMLQPHVLASVEVHCWILLKFFKTQHQHVLITRKSHCWYRLHSPFVHNYHVWHQNETMLYILFCNLLLFSLMMSIVSFY